MKLSTLQDDFNDGVINPTLWSIVQPTQWTETTTLNSLFVSSGATNAYITSNSFYDITNDYFSFKLEYSGVLSSNTFLVRIVNDYTIYGSYSIGLGFYDSLGVKSLAIWISAPGSEFAYDYITAYDSTVHKYLKVRLDATNIYFDGSTDGITYTNLYTDTISNINRYPNLDLSNIKLQFYKLQSTNVTPAVTVQVSNLNKIMVTPKGVKLRGKIQIRGKCKIR